MSIPPSWHQIHIWLKQNNAQGLSHLNAGAAKQTLQALQQETGLELPESWQQLYTLHDGENDDWPHGIFAAGQRFLPLEEVRTQWLANMQFASLPQGQINYPFWKVQANKQDIFIKGPVKPMASSSLWLPFTMGESIWRFVDFDPAPGGSVGQIIEVDLELGIYQQLANSLQDYLRVYAHALQEGKYYVSEGQIVPTIEEEISDWSLPSWLENVQVETIELEQLSDSSELKDLKPGQVYEVVGQMGFLSASDNQSQFALVTKDGVELSLLATSQSTNGYGSIALRQYARVKLRAISDDDLLWQDGSQYFALEYGMLFGPKGEIALKAEPKFTNVIISSLMMLGFFLLGLVTILFSLLGFLWRLLFNFSTLGNSFSPPDNIHLKLDPHPSWLYKAKIKQDMAELDALGFRPAQAYQVQGIKGMNILALFRQDDPVVMVYYFFQQSAWVDVVAQAEEKMITVSNAPMGHDIPCPPFLKKEVYQKYSVGQLLEKMEAYRQERFIDINADNFVRSMEDAYAREIRWQKEHGSLANTRT